MRRGLKQQILHDIDSFEPVSIFLTGPRGAGKTFLALDIARSYKNSLYLNCERAEDAVILRDKRRCLADLVVFDAIHELPNWQEFAAELIVSPSANAVVIGDTRLDALLATYPAQNRGRVFSYRVFPFTPAELAAADGSAEITRLLNRGGFPEPFLSGSDSLAQNWRERRIEQLFSEDIPKFSLIYDTAAMRRCLEFLQRSAGAPVSYTLVKREAGIANVTAKKYFHILEALDIIFLVRPFSQRIPRAIKKEPKVYFYDTGMVADAGKKLENLAALSLLREADCMSREQGVTAALRYAQTRDNQKIDFCFVKNNTPHFFAKVSALETADKSLRYFCRAHGVRGIQIVQNLEHEYRCSAKPGIDMEIRRADKFLGSLL
ncbi:MAG: ATP-binding protein [Treponemataceae bacterium]|nr:MAG: ATP-binding protein [Treponemataceae bacterium]